MTEERARRIRVTGGGYKISPFISWMRDQVVYILLWTMTIIAAFEAGMIFEFKGLDSYSKRMGKAESAIQELAGKVESHQAMLRGIAKGRTPQIP